MTQLIGLGQTDILNETGWLNFLGEWPGWASFLTKLGLILVVGYVIYFVGFFVLRRILKRTPWAGTADVLLRCRSSLRLLVPAALLLALLPTIGELDESTAGTVRHFVSIFIILCVTWFLLSLIDAGGRLVKTHHRIDVADNYEARRIHTQITVLERALDVLVIVIGVAVALMTFPRIRELGASLLASAGLAGLVIGLAARPVIENLLAGIQIALTQPINIDDVVIIEGEWGRIEQITTTYVVVKIWDDRRLIVPFSKFISEPFQNWTRRTAQLLGTVFLYTDYSVPLDELRDELKRICENASQWDGRVCNIQVTDSTERTMQVRALVSAEDSGKAWELRVLVREKLIEYLQKHHPDALPRMRVQMDDDADLQTQEDATTSA